MAFMFRVILILTARFLSVLEGAPVLTVDDNPSIYSSVATLKCSDASYTAGSGYRWTKDGVTVFNNAGEISTSGKYSEEIDGTTFKLIIDNLVVDDEGSYSCSYAFQDSNTLNLEIESRGKVTAELSKGKLEVTFSEIYPSTIIVVVTCGTKQVNGAFITNDTNGDRFDRKWESTTLLVADDVKSGCSATATLRSAFTIGFTVSTGSTTTSSTNTSTSSNTTATVNASTTSTAANTPTTAPIIIPCDDTCIIIIVVCVVLFVALLALFFACYLLRRRRNKKKKYKSKETNSSQSCDNDINL